MGPCNNHDSTNQILLIQLKYVVWKSEGEIQLNRRDIYFTFWIVDVSSVTLEPRDNPLTLIEGSQREVRCTVNSNAFPTPTYAWFIDTKDITSRVGSDTSSVIITGSKIDNGKVLRCQATNNNRPKNGNTVLNITCKYCEYSELLN